MSYQNVTTKMRERKRSDEVIPEHTRGRPSMPERARGRPSRLNMLPDQE